MRKSRGKYTKIRKAQEVKYIRAAVDNLCDFSQNFTTYRVGLETVQIITDDRVSVVQSMTCISAP